MEQAITEIDKDIYTAKAKHNGWPGGRSIAVGGAAEAGADAGTGLGTGHRIAVTRGWRRRAGNHASAERAFIEIREFVTEAAT